MLVDRISQHTFLAKYISQDAVVLDLGFNTGEFSYPMISKYSCRIYAVEPVRAFCSQARPNENLTLVNAAVSDTNKKIRIISSSNHELSATILDKDTVASVYEGGATNTTVVDGITLDWLIETTGSETIDLIKVDIEGAELDVLPSIPEATLQRIGQIAVEFHDYWYPELSEKTEAVKQELQRRGFDMIRFTPNNKDVLFVNRSLIRVGRLERFWITQVLRNVNGFGRMLLIPLRRLGLWA